MNETSCRVKLRIRGNNTSSLILLFKWVEEKCRRRRVWGRRKQREKLDDGRGRRREKMWSRCLNVSSQESLSPSFAPHSFPFFFVELNLVSYIHSLSQNEKKRNITLIQISWREKKDNYCNPINFPIKTSFIFSFSSLSELNLIPFHSITFANFSFCNIDSQFVSRDSISVSILSFPLFSEDIDHLDTFSSFSHLVLGSFPSKLIFHLLLL